MLAHAAAAAPLLSSIERRPILSPEPFAAALAAPADGPAVLLLNRRVATTLPMVRLIEAWAYDLLARGERFGLLDDAGAPVPADAYGLSAP